MGKDRSQYLIFLDGAEFPIRVTVEGAVEVWLPPAPPEIRDFGSPKPLLLTSAQTAVDLEVTVADALEGFVPAFLSVTNLSLFRRDERVQAERTVHQEISTVLSGTLHIMSALDQERVLSPGEDIRFEKSEGEIRAIRFQGKHFEFDFFGKVRGLKTCIRGTCNILMPSYWEWLKK